MMLIYIAGDADPVELDLPDPWLQILKERATALGLSIEGFVLRELEDLLDARGLPRDELRNRLQVGARDALLRGL